MHGLSTLCEINDRRAAPFPSPDIVESDAADESAGAPCAGMRSET